MFSNLSIRARISIAFSILVVLLLSVAAFSQFGTKAGRDALHTMYDINLSSALAIGDAKYNLAIARVSIDRAMLHPDASDVKTLLLPKAQEYVDKARKSYARYLMIPKGDEERRIADTVATSFNALIEQGIEPTLRALKDGNVAAADQLTMNVTRDLSLRLTVSTAALDDYVLRRGASSYARFQSTLSTVSLVSAIALVLSVLIALTCAVGLNRAIARPLESALYACASIERGDLSQGIQKFGRDEMNTLLGGLSSMQSGLRGTVATFRDSSESIASATQQIAAGNGDLSRRTEAQAAALQQTAASMEELTATVRQNNQSASNASHLASRAMEVAHNGGTMMEHVVKTMSEINGQSAKIATIIETIEGIAFQTNILALNAAVEAARAGEQGRGFAVVATEVRNLAQRSSSAAKEIKVLIDNAIVSVAEGAGMVASAEATMREIVQSSQKVNEILGEVAVASKEQSDGIEQISRAVSQMDQVTQQNAALVEQTTAAAISLAEQATALREAAGRFII